MTTSGSVHKNERDIPDLDLKGGIRRFLRQRRSMLNGSHLEMSDRHAAIKCLQRFATSDVAVQDRFMPLINILQDLWRSERTGNTSDTELVYCLQKKFALAGRLSKFYGQHMKRAGDQDASGDELAFFAGLLLIRHGRNFNLNEVNSALKLLDAAVASHPDCSDVIQSAIVLERKTLEGIING